MCLNEPRCRASHLPVTPQGKAHQDMPESILLERTEGCLAGHCRDLRHSDQKHSRPLLLQGHFNEWDKKLFYTGQK